MNALLPINKKTCFLKSLESGFAVKSVIINGIQLIILLSVAAHKSNAGNLAKLLLTTFISLLVVFQILNLYILSVTVITNLRDQNSIQSSQLYRYIVSTVAKELCLLIGGVLLILYVDLNSYLLLMTSSGCLSMSILIASIGWKLSNTVEQLCTQHAHNQQLHSIVVVPFMFDSDMFDEPPPAYEDLSGTPPSYEHTVTQTQLHPPQRSVSNT